MTDILTKEHRSWNMSRIRSKDTAPEIRVRSLLHSAGFRFRLHVKNLSGSPDIVLSKHRTVIFVHGCYWHRHPGCKYTYTPKSRVEFWKNKFEENIHRDQINTKLLKEQGWKVEIVWECQTKEEDVLRKRIRGIFQ